MEIRSYPIQVTGIGRWKSLRNRRFVDLLSQESELPAARTIAKLGPTRCFIGGSRDLWIGRRAPPFNSTRRWFIRENAPPTCPRTFSPLDWNNSDCFRRSLFRRDVHRSAECDSSFTLCVSFIAGRSFRFRRSSRLLGSLTFPVWDLFNKLADGFFIPFRFAEIYEPTSIMLERLPLSFEYRGW